MDPANPIFTTIEQIELHYKSRDLTDFTLNQKNELVPKTRLQKISSLFSKNLELEYNTLRNTLKERELSLEDREIDDLTHAPKEKFILYSFYFPEIVRKYLDGFESETGVKINLRVLTGEHYSLLEELREELKTTNAMWEIIDKIIPAGENVRIQNHKSGETSITAKITDLKDNKAVRRELSDKHFTDIDELIKTVDALNKNLRSALAQANLSDVSATATARLSTGMTTTAPNEKRKKDIEDQIAKLRRSSPNNPLIKVLIDSLKPSLGFEVQNVVQDQKKITEYLSITDDMHIIDDFVKLHMKALFIRNEKGSPKTDANKPSELKLTAEEEDLQKVMRLVNALGFRETTANHMHREFWVFDPNTSINEVEIKQKEFAESVIPEIIDAKFPREKIAGDTELQGIEADLKVAEMGYAAVSIESYNNQLKSWLRGNWKSTEFDRHYESALKVAAPLDSETLAIFNKYKTDMEKTIEELFFAKNRCINRQFFSKKLNKN